MVSDLGDMSAELGLIGSRCVTPSGSELDIERCGADRHDSELAIYADHFTARGPAITSTIARSAVGSRGSRPKANGWSAPSLAFQIGR
jgi:hypothetical protein